MSRLILLYLVLFTISNLPYKTESCQHCHTTEEASTGQAYATKGGSGDVIYVSTERHPYASKGGSDEVVYAAAHASFPGKPYDEYYGCVATIDVYGYNLSRGQQSASSIYIVNVGNWSKESFNSITVGWMVSPEIYGDSRTHFYTHWTKDGYGRSGCYNMDCPGFQLEPGSKITPGAIINSATVGGSSHTITIKVFKEKSSGNWWLYCGMNDDTPTAVGYYPANIFTTLAEKVNAIAFGGESIAKRSLRTPPMGSGSLPSGNAASFSNLQFVDHDGQATLIQSDLPTVAKTPKCYYVSPIIGAKFFYGGPAGCF